MYMSHFYANPLSPLLCYERIVDIKEFLTVYHLEAVRNLPSFRRYLVHLISSNKSECLSKSRRLVEVELENRNTREVRKLLEDDDHLRDVIVNNMEVVD